MFWYTQAPLVALQACRRRLKNKNTPVVEMTGLVNMFQYVVFYVFGKEQHRRGTQFHTEK